MPHLMEPWVLSCLKNPVHEGWRNHNRYGDGQNPVPLVNINIAGKWMFIPLQMVLWGIDPWTYQSIHHFLPFKTVCVFLGYSSAHFLLEKNAPHRWIWWQWWQQKGPPRMLVCNGLCRPITKSFKNPQHCRPRKINMLTGPDLQFVENGLDIHKASTPIQHWSARVFPVAQVGGIIALVQKHPKTIYQMASCLPSGNYSWLD